VSAQEKRAEMLKAIGVDESDISTEVIVGKGGATNKKNPVPGKKAEEKGKNAYILSIREYCIVPGRISTVGPGENLGRFF
jgi:hypothetical protein